MKKILLLVMVLCGLGWGGHALWKRSESARAAESKKGEVKTLKPEERDLKQVYRANGTIMPALSTEIRSEVTGTIAKLLVRAGDSVVAGQALMELDQSEMLLRIGELKLQIEAARLREQRAGLNFNRRQTLAARDFINAKDLEDSRTDHLLAVNALEAERARLKTLENQLARTLIPAPYGGLVLDLQAKPGMVVTGALAGREGTVLMTVADLSRLKVQAEVNQVDVAQLNKGMEVKLTFDSAPNAVLTGTIEYISPSALTKTEARNPGGSSPNPETVRNFPVEIGFTSDDARIRPGMTANIEMPIASATKALSVEVTAVFLENGEPCVYIPSGNSLVKRPVKTGVNDSRFVEIKEGLAPGEEVSLVRPPKKPEAPKKKKR
jgi:HlyD family secretion protein